MDFSDTDWNKLLPAYLSASDKTRLKTALMQFKKENHTGSISYNDFYAKYGFSYFVQTDLLAQVRTSYWDASSQTYATKFVNSIIVSNSCDISFENTRVLNEKQCLFAPLVPLDVYLENLRLKNYPEDKLTQLTVEIKSQLVTNIFYLPVGGGGSKDYVALLDQLFWFPTTELKDWLAEIDRRKLTSLNQFGFYLFILKLSFHLCRLPEDEDRLFQVPTT